MLAGEGNKAAKAGDFEEAVRKYSDAIELYPFDHRYCIYTYVKIHIVCTATFCAQILGESFFLLRLSSGL